MNNAQPIGPVASAALNFTKHYHRFIESELKRAIIEIEGELPALEEIARHGEVVLFQGEYYEDAGAGVVYIYKWKSEVILQICAPKLIDGNLKLKVRRMQKKPA